MLEYLIIAATTFFMGFFPMFEVYLAVPAGIGLGMDVFSSVFWGVLGNWLVIPFVSYFYFFLLKSKKIKLYFEKISRSNTSQKIQKGGFWFVLISTPLLGSWALAVAGKLVDIDKRTLYISSGMSISLYGIIVGILTSMGIDTFF